MKKLTKIAIALAVSVPAMSFASAAAASHAPYSQYQSSEAYAFGDWVCNGSELSQCTQDSLDPSSSGCKAGTWGQSDWSPAAPSDFCHGAPTPPTPPTPPAPPKPPVPPAPHGMSLKVESTSGRPISQLSVPLLGSKFFMLVESGVTDKTCSQHPLSLPHNWTTLEGKGASYNADNHSCAFKASLTAVRKAKSGDSDLWKFMSYDGVSSASLKVTVGGKPVPPAPHGGRIPPLTPANKKLAVYMMTQDIGALNESSLTSEAKQAGKVALYPAKDTGSTVKPADCHGISSDTSAYCKMIDTKIQAQQADKNTDVELMLAFEKPHTGRNANGTFDALFQHDAMTTMNQFNELTGFSFPKTLHPQQVKYFISALHKQGIYVFDSVGGWDYSNPVIKDSSASSSNPYPGLVDLYYQGLKFDSVVGAMARTTEPDNDYVNTECKSNILSCVVNKFDYFPWPGDHDQENLLNADSGLGLGSQLDNNSDDRKNNTQYVKNWVTTAELIGADGIDVDYEETWLADLTATKPANIKSGAYLSKPSYEKYAAILNAIAHDAKVAKDPATQASIQLSTAAPAVGAAPVNDSECGTSGNCWWLSNLKGIAYMAVNSDDTSINTQAAFAYMDHIGLMTYDMDTDVTSGWAPDSAGGYSARDKMTGGVYNFGRQEHDFAFDLDTQTQNYVKDWKTILSDAHNIIGGVELGQPAFPTRQANGRNHTACMVPRKVGTSVDKCGATQLQSTNVDKLVKATGHGMIVWEMNKGTANDSSATYADLIKAWRTSSLLGDYVSSLY